MQTEQRIAIIDRSKVEIDGVTAVRMFDENGVVLESAMGLISVEGGEMKIENFEQATNKILITGIIKGVFYLEKAEKKRGRRLFQ